MNPSLGILYALSSAASYGLMSFLLHWNPQQFPPEQLIFIRSLFSFACLLPFCWDGTPRFFRKDSKLLWIRSFAGAGGLLCYYYALQGTISSNANFLFSCSPVFVVIFSRILFGERITRTETGGIALIVFASFLLYLPNRESMPTWVWLVGGAGALFSSVAFLSLGAATKIYSSSLIVFGLSFVGMIVTGLMPSAPWIAPVPSDYLFLLATSFLGLISQLLATLSFAHLKSSIATAIGRTSILASGLLELGIAGYRPHILEWISYVVILLGIYYSQPRTKRTAAKPAK